jgi:uncharacterized alkaline shock family protein YloU
MTTDVAPARHATPLAPAEDRGQLTIAPAALRVIVEAASGEVEGVVAEGRGGVMRSSRASHARVLLDGTTASVRLRVTLTYPQSIPDELIRLRSHIINRVHDLAAITVRACDIEVAALEPAKRRVG